MREMDGNMEPPEVLGRKRIETDAPTEIIYFAACRS
jgi:hypothetical protein